MIMLFRAGGIVRGALAKLLACCLVIRLYSEHIEKSVFQEYPHAFIVGDRAPLSASHEVKFAITQRNIDRLDDMLESVSYPKSPTYGEFMTRQAISELTSNMEATDAVLRFLEMIGVVHEVKRTRYGEYVTAVAPIALWEAALHAKFVTITSAKDSSKTAIRTMEYSLPTILEGYVITVLNTVQTPVFDDHRGPILSASKYLSGPQPIPFGVIQSLRNGVHGVDPDDNNNNNNNNNNDNKDDSNNGRSRPVAMIIGYTYPLLLNTVYNINSNIGSPEVSQGVFETADQVLSRRDLSIFDSAFNIPYVEPTKVIGGHVADVCPNVLKCGEANLDVQYLSAMAQNIPTTYWYTRDTSSSSFTNWIVDVADDPNPPMVLSISYSISEHYLSLYEVLIFDIEAKKLGLQGVTILAASGDAGVAGDGVTGDSCGYNPVFPASSPYVTAVGGTQGPERNAPETACQTNLGNSAITTGGGFSNLYRLPEWQRSAVSGYFAGLRTENRPFTNSTASKGGGGGSTGSQFPFQAYNRRGRGYPDVSLLAVKYVVSINGSFYPADGTSTSCPVVAAMVSLVNSMRLKSGKPPLGWLNPTIYASNGSFARDILTGENKCLRGDQVGVCCKHGFKAAAGWDPVTGFGSVDFAKFSSLFLSAASPVKPKRKPTVYQEWVQYGVVNIARNPTRVLQITLFFVVLLVVLMSYCSSSGDDDQLQPTAALPGGHQYGSLDTSERAVEMMQQGNDISSSRGNTAATSSGSAVVNEVINDRTHLV